MLLGENDLAVAWGGMGGSWGEEGVLQESGPYVDRKVQFQTSWQKASKEWISSSTDRNQSTLHSSHLCKRFTKPPLCSSSQTPHTTVALNIKVCQQGDDCNQPPLCNTAVALKPRCVNRGMIATNPPSV